MLRVRLTAAALGVLAASGVLVAPAAAAGVAGTEAVYDYVSAVREQVWVQTAVDSDADGKPDRVAVRIIRPAESDAGLKVPVIMEASPYFGGVRSVPNHDDVDRGADATALAAAAPVAVNRAAEISFSGYLDNYFVPRGYAVAFADSLGTGDSEGCPTAGGRNETLGIKAVIDWFNGRAPAFDAAGQPVSASWSTGHTGMIGMSYDGTLPNAVAATGVPGLDTIVPIAAISSWYDYYRSDGGVVAPGGYQGEDTDIMAKAVLTRANPEVCDNVTAELTRDQDRTTGDYNAYWDERNYLHDAGKVKASVFLVHGLHDDNVRTQQTGQWWNELAAYDVPRKIWLHQGEHFDPFTVRRDVWLDTLHKWFDYWLYQIDNGIMSEPMADIETAPNEWRTAASWPVPGSHPVTFRLGDGTLSTARAVTARRQTFVDDPARTAKDLASNETVTDPNRLVYLTAPLARETRLSGHSELTLRADVTGDSPFLTAMLVDYGTGVRYAGQRVVPIQDCVGPSTDYDSGCFFRREWVTAETSYEIVTRGWLDVRNRVSASRSDPIVKGQPYTFRWNLQTDDHVFPVGHRIGLVVISTDRDHTLRYPAGTVIGVTPAGSKLELSLS